MTVSVRRMTIEDIDRILEIEAMCFDSPWPRVAFENDLENKDAIYLCILFNKKIIGYAGLTKIFDEGHISNVAISPMFRGCGHSKILLNNLIEISENNGIEKFTLEVRVSNMVAIKLYESLGFVNVGNRPNYYFNPTEDAAIMWRY